MSTIHMRDIELHTFGELPTVGEMAPNFLLTQTNLETVSLENYAGRAMLLNVYPSIDTDVCFNSVQTFNKAIEGKKDVVIACISMDLPFALKRINEGEGLKNVILLSDFRNREFGDLYGLTIADGPLAGLLARAVIVLDEQHNVVYHELVEDVTTPPNYDEALRAILK